MDNYVNLILYILVYIWIKGVLASSLEYIKSNKILTITEMCPEISYLTAPGSINSKNESGSVSHSSSQSEILSASAVLNGL